ncbi:MAG: hypothetical protein M0038_13995 [Pseudomonadota bacterium]|jgi:hypothetical protein|nr:hypothetical protein [Pseudomonadota bacterium]
MTNAERPSGELFSRLYIERGAPAQDSPFFRNRLSGYLSASHYEDGGAISAYLKEEGGLILSYNGYWDFDGFFTKTRIEFVLSSITLIWRFLKKQYPSWNGTSGPAGFTYPKADAWHGFVQRALREENLAYSLDELCGVHYFVDEEFERNRVSVLRAASAPRYSGVLAAFQSAHSHLDAQPADTKASVRSMFEAVEILARLVDPNSQRLNRRLVEKLKTLVSAAGVDSIERDCREKLLEGVADWVDAIHLYRHGQGLETPVAPSLEVAVYVLSSGAAALRLLLAVDSSLQKAGDRGAAHAGESTT